MITPEQLAKCGSEHGHQCAIFCWAATEANNSRPELRTMFAIPNGGERNKIVAANLKAEGVKSSIPDIFLPVARGPWHGLFIELKRPAANGKPAGRATPEQLATIEALRAQGYGAVVCVGWQAAVATILAYLDWNQK